MLGTFDSLSGASVMHQRKRKERVSYREVRVQHQGSTQGASSLVEPT